MGQGTPRLSVVIVSYNTRDDLRACLTAVHQCDTLPEIIVVDNASTDGSAAMVREEFPDALLLTPERNLWFTGGNNLGMAAARGDYVLLLNPDTIPDKGAIEKLLAFAHEHPEYAGATAQLRYPNGGVQRTGSRVPTLRYLLMNHTLLGWLLPRQKAEANAWHWYAGWERDTDHEVEVPPGSCVLGRRSVLRMDERLLLYFPEDDIAHQTGGKPFYFLADATIIHREKSSTRNWLATEIYFRDLLVYTCKYHGALNSALMYALSRPILWGMWFKRVLRQTM